MIVSSSDNTTVCVWDAISCAVVSEMRGHEAIISAVRFSLGGHHVVSGSLDNTVRVWDIVSASQAYPAFRGHEHWVSSVAFSNDGNCIISESSHDTISWDVTSGRRHHLIEHSDRCSLHSIYNTYDGWIVDVVTNQILCKLPPIFAITCKATNK
jgi:WD40 repeat protein